MRILIGSDAYYPMVDGQSYFTQRLASGLAKHGHEVFVMTAGRTMRDTLLIREGVHVYNLRSIPLPIYPSLHYRITPSFWASKAIARYVAEIQPDIVHIQDHYLIAKCVADSARAQHIPTVGTNHFMPENVVHYLHLPAPLEKPVIRLGWRHLAHVYRQLDRITVPTRTAAEHMMGLPLRLCVTPISCGIDLERFNPKGSGAYLRKRYDIAADRLILLYVGRLDREKRLEGVLEALPLIAASVNVQLVIAGIGKLRELLQALAAKLGVLDRVTFTGFVPDADLPSLYRVADAFVMPGIAELQSIVTLEALASGLPVLAANAVALPELVRHGKNGFLFADGDTKQLAAYATTLLTDEALRQRMGEESRKLVQKHDIDAQLESYEKLYLEVIKARTESQLGTTDARRTR